MYKYENLNQSNRLAYLWNRCKAGLRSIPESPARSALTALYWFTALLLLLHAAGPADGIIGHLMQPLVCILVVLGSIIFFVTGVTISAIPRGAFQTADAFRRVGLTNAAGEPPLLASCRKEDSKTVIDVFTQGLTIPQLQERIEPLESALGKRITKIEPGEDNQSIRLHLAPGNTKLPELAYLPQGQPLKPLEILLGTSLDGPVTWDPDKVPHLLIGGSTGSGKTTIGKTIISQCLPMGDVYIIDLKGGLDYPPQWQTQSCSFATTSFDALSVTGQIVQQLNQRKEMFDAVVRYDGIPCSGLSTFNQLRPEVKLHPIFVFTDEIAEITDTTGMDKPHKEEAAAIVGNLSTIARQGRALGIHLIVMTQRPDAVVVPGQIKNNLDGRICGKADNVLSQIILDNTDAADRIPKDSQGLFLNQDGILFRGYLFDNEEGVSHAT